MIRNPWKEGESLGPDKFERFGCGHTYTPMLNAQHGNVQNKLGRVIFIYPLVALVTRQNITTMEFTKVERN